MTTTRREAGAFPPAAGSAPVTGSLVVEGGTLRFTPDDDGGPQVVLPLDRLDVRMGGAADRLVFFTSELASGWTFFTADRSILAEPELLSRPHLAASIASLKRRRLGGAALVAGALLLAVAAVAGLFLLKDPLVRFVASQVPVAAEVRLGSVAMSQFRIGKTFLEDAEIREGIDAMTAPLLEAIPKERYPFEFHVVEDSSVNAFALPGGQVVIHTGLLLAAESPSEVTGVLAHEIAHVTERHGMRQIIGTLGLFALVQAAVGDVGGLVAVLANGGAQLLTLRFSRDFEREADDTGWRYLVTAGLDPAGLVTFFRRLEAREKEMAKSLPGGESAAGSAAMSLLSTHPATAERIARLEARLAKEKPAAAGGSGSAFDFRAFQDRLRDELESPTK